MGIFKIDISDRATFSILVIRIVLSILVAAHGLARLIEGAAPPFGSFLTAQGFPFGELTAWGITLFEIVGAFVFLLGRLIFPITLAYSFIYFMGILLVHGPEGWFVVGLGRNGMEYSVLLIVCFLAVGIQEMPGKWLKGADSAPNG